MSSTNPNNIEDESEKQKEEIKQLKEKMIELEDEREKQKEEIKHLKERIIELEDVVLRILNNHLI